MIRTPTVEDIPFLYDLIHPYAGQSWQGKQVAVDKDIILESLHNVVTAKNFVAVMSDHGLAFGYYGQSWWAEPDCAVDFFYTNKPGAGRELAQAMIDGFKARHCGWMYAGAESDISSANNRLYQNLFRKFGFRDIGGGRMILNLRGK